MGVVEGVSEALWDEGGNASRNVGDQRGNVMAQRFLGPILGETAP